MTGERWRADKFSGAIAAAALLFLGLAIRGLLRHPIWLDEAYAVAVARQDLLAIAPSLADESGPPLYYLVLHLWTSIFGEGPVAVRSLSILFGLLLVPAGALLARRLAGDRAAVLAAFILAASPMTVQFAQEARMYTLLPLFAALAAERVAAYAESGSRAAPAAIALFLAAACYTHNWGLFLLPAAAAAALLLPGPRRPGAAAAIVGAVVLYAPWLPVVFRQAADPSYRFIEMVQTARAFTLPFRSAILFGSGVGTTGGEARSLLPWPGAVLVACGWALALVAALRHPERRRLRTGALLLGLGPLAIAAVCSGLSRPVYLVGRYEIMTLPILAALVAAGAADLLRGRLLATVATAWVLMLAILSFGFTGRIQRRFPEPLFAERLAPALRKEDRVVFTGLYRAATDYHLRRAGAEFAPLSFPPDVALHLGWFYDGLYDPADPRLAEAARAACPREGTRTWVVASATRTCDLLLRELSACARLSAPFAASGAPFTALLLAEPRGAVP